jgi:hypothetical protein
MLTEPALRQYFLKYLNIFQNISQYSQKISKFSHRNKKNRFPVWANRKRPPNFNCAKAKTPQQRKFVNPYHQNPISRQAI